MNPISVNSYLFSSVRAGFSAPEFIKSELKEHKSECLLKSGLSEHEFEIRRKEVEESIEFVKVSKYEEFLERVAALLPDPDDIDFLALALSVNAVIWSNDAHLKQQSLVPVFTSEDLVKMLIKCEI